MYVATTEPLPSELIIPLVNVQKAWWWYEVKCRSSDQKTRVVSKEPDQVTQPLDLLSDALALPPPRPP